MFKQIVVIILLGFLLYLNVVHGQFIWDDFYCVKYNEYIKNISNIWKLFTEASSMGAGVISSFYRPFQMITYMMDYQLWGLNVVGYHITNIVLHILVTLCIYWLTVILFEKQLLASLTSILYLIHPIHTETVAYIAGRAESLAALFILLTIIFYIKYAYSKNIVAIVLMIVSYAIALLSKEYSLVTLVLLLVYGLVFKKKMLNAGFIFLFLVSSIYIVIRITVFKSITFGINTNSSFLQRIPGFFVAIYQYLRIMFLPFNLHMEYGNAIFHFTDFRAIIGIVFFFSSLIGAFIKKKTDKLFSFSIFWFNISLLPVANIYPINAYMAEHWLYIPSIGFFLILARLLSKLCIKEKRKYLGRIIIVFLLLFYSFLTINQNNYWKNFIFFCKRTLKISPYSATMYNNLGNAYSDTGQYREAIASYQKALELDPAMSGVYYNLADAYTALGEYESAIKSYKKLLVLNPDDINILRSLAFLYNKIQDKTEMQTLQKRIKILTMELVQRNYSLGNKFKDEGKIRKAIVYYKKALEVDPYNVIVLNELASVYIILGQYEEAKNLLEKANELVPNSAVIHNNLAVVYYYLKNYESAIEYCDSALKLGYEVSSRFIELLRPHRK